MFRKSLLTLLLVVLSCMTSSFTASAQSAQDYFKAYVKAMESNFNKAKQQMERNFNSYRDSINNQFSEQLKKNWGSADLNESKKEPVKPEPRPVMATDEPVTSNPLPFVEVEPVAPVAPKSEVVSRPAAPEVSKPVPDMIPETRDADGPYFRFNYFGADCKVRLPEEAGYEIRVVGPDQAQEAWSVLTSGKYDGYINDCVQYRNKMALSDWAMYQFVVLTSKAYFGSDDSDEATLFQMYSLSQLGFRVRLGIQDGHFINLIAVAETVYGRPYMEMDGLNYYRFSDKKTGGGIRLCEFAFPNERTASLKMENLPLLPMNHTQKKQIKSVAYPHLVADISVNRNLIKFFDTYPVCRWDLFAQASLSKDLKSQLYPVLKRAITGRTEQEAANMLINFVQTGFQYKTDGEQFGREKTFFGDEPFYYPYCDCEDRSILYSILVGDLLGLDVVLLEYPSHIATAVRFNEDIKGDYFTINGTKYIICDPTYIGASIGKCMSTMLNKQAKVIRIR